jgi:hypothetical protein
MTNPSQYALKRDEARRQGMDGLQHEDGVARAPERCAAGRPHSCGRGGGRTDPGCVQTKTCQARARVTARVILVSKRARQLPFVCG